MAGSYEHVTKDGTFNSDAFYDGIENLGDAYECVEELCGMVADLRAELAQFQNAVEHVTENGKTTRSVSHSDKWAIVHSERLSDLECAEEKLALIRKAAKDCLESWEAGYRPHEVADEAARLKELLKTK